MLTKIIDRVGDANPQIFRELKERLTPSNIAIVAIGSLIIQGLVLIYFHGQLPVFDPFDPKTTEVSNYYCGFSTLRDGDYDRLCKLGGDGKFIINWQKWHADVFSCLSWILPFGLILGSVYLLVADLVLEEKRGTLNFIRLSPQSAQQIFVGKILGVPILVYIATVLMLPLHLYLGCSAGGNILFLGSWYLTIGALWFLLASAAVLYVLLGGFQAILTVIAVSYPLWMPIAAINSFASSTLTNDLSFASVQISWFGIPFASNATLFNIFGTICFLGSSYWVWQVLERRYHSPTATIISKSQSYLANLCWQIWVAGFVIPVLVWSQDNGVFSMSWLTGMNFIALLLLIPMLLPSKQALQDWSRYRRERVTHQHRQFWRRELVQDLIHNDKSPALLAIALNIGMATIFWIPVTVITSLRDPIDGIKTLAGIVLAASLILIYTTIAHLGLFFNVKNRKLGTIPLIGGTMLAPIIAAGLLSVSHVPSELGAFLLLFSPFAAIGIAQGAGVSIFTAFVAQLGLLAVLTRQLQRKIQISGRSQLEELTTNNLA